MKYVKGLGVYVGEFNQDDLDKGIDKQKVEEAKQKYNLPATNTKVTKNSIKIWVCTYEDFKI